MARRHVTFGIIGSAFHTGIFVSRPRCIILNQIPEVWSNQIVLDSINEAGVDYYCPDDGVTNTGRDGSFGNDSILNKPHGLAHLAGPCDGGV